MTERGEGRRQKERKYMSEIMSDKRKEKIRSEGCKEEKREEEEQRR